MRQIGVWAKAAPSLRPFGAGMAIAALCVAAGAQTLPARVYPAGSLQGNAEFGAFPSVTINCQSYTLGPGARVYDSKNRILLTGQLQGVSAPVVFQRDPMGNIVQVWLLSPEQARMQLAPKAPSSCLFGN